MANLVQSVPTLSEGDRIFDRTVALHFRLFNFTFILLKQQMKEYPSFENIFVKTNNTYFYFHYPF
jgi:hypothetical protein